MPLHLPLDLSHFEEVVRPVSFYFRPALTVSPAGRVTLNDRLRRDLPTLAFRLLVSPNRRVIVLDPGGPANYSFPKDGCVNDPEFCRKLSQSGIELPARYVAEWNDVQNIWVCTYASSAPPDPAELARKLPPPKRSYTRRVAS